MARLYMDIKARFEFETMLDGSAIPVAIQHLTRLLNAHESVCGFQLLDVERTHESMILIHTQLLLEQAFTPFFTPDGISDSFHQLAGSSHDMHLQGTPLSLTRLHRARVLA